MPFIDLAQCRFSVRKFDGKPVKKNKLKQIIEAGRIAPTAKNQQPQRIYVIQSKEKLERINGVCSCIYGASTVLLVCYDSNEDWKNPLDSNVRSGETDTSIVLTHMMLQAQELGVNSCWVKYFNPADVACAMELPENHIPVAIMPLGIAEEGVEPSPSHKSVKEEKETVFFV